MSKVTIKFWDKREQKYITQHDIGFGFDLAVNDRGEVYLIDCPETIDLAYVEAHFYKDGERIA